MNAKFIESVQTTYDSAIASGQTIEINKSQSFVSINTNIEEYFFEGHEADELIEKTENSLLAEHYSIEVILLWEAQGW